MLFASPPLKRNTARSASSNKAIGVTATGTPLHSAVRIAALDASLLGWYGNASRSQPARSSSDRLGVRKPVSNVTISSSWSDAARARQRAISLRESG